MGHPAIINELVVDLEQGTWKVQKVADASLIGPFQYGWDRFKQDPQSMTFGGGLLLLGLYTRPVAFILSGEMAVAYWQFHFPRGAWPILNHGEPAVLLCFIFLYLAFVGPGPWSIDALRSRGTDSSRRTNAAV